MPLFGGNDISGVGGHGWLDSYWGLIVPLSMSPFGIFLLKKSESSGDWILLKKEKPS
jgi:multiple sugar transport system permease protein